VGIVHRDVKPENVMLSETAETQPCVKLLDFDIAKSQSLTRLTETGEILGTVSYLAPEQITAQASSPASDTHALGVVFYELLTLERPFLGEAPMDIVRQILEADPVPPASLRPDIPADLSALVVEMLSKIAERRPDDAALASRLSAIAVAA
jgi:serine/threonine-protein kinase